MEIPVLDEASYGLQDGYGEALKKTKEKDLKVVIDTTNEIIVMAAVVLDEKARKKYINLSPDLFLGPAHMEMWTCLQELFRRGLDYSPETVRTIAGDAFDHKVLDEHIRSRDGLVANLPYHVQCLRFDKMRNDVVKGPLPLFMDALKDPQAEPERLNSLLSQVRSCFDGASSQYIQSGRSVVAEHATVLRERRLGVALYPFGIKALDEYCVGDVATRRLKHKDGSIEEYKIELYDVDSKKGKPRMVPGMAPGLTTAITGLSGSGKSVITANVIANVVKRKRKVLWGAWEMPTGDSLEMAGVIEAGYSRTDFQTGQYGEEDEQDLLGTMNNLADYIDFFTLPEIKSKGDKFEKFNDRTMESIHQAVAESGCYLFVADVFKYALTEQRPEDESRAIKYMGKIAKKCKCHILLVHHMNLKELEGRQDKRPTRETVMGSSGWINDVDNVLACHNPFLFGGESEFNDKFEVHVLKQRYGIWPQAIEFDWDAEYGAITGGRTIRIASIGDEAEGRVDARFLDLNPKPTPKGGGRAAKPSYRKRERAA